MIERLRELLSLDTSIPTLPTQVELETKATPISLDITNSMLSRSYSIDTKERATLQTTPYSRVGAITSDDKERILSQLQRIDQLSMQSKTPGFLTSESELLRQTSRVSGQSESIVSSTSMGRKSKSNESSIQENSARKHSNGDNSNIETVSLGSKKLYLSQASNREQRGLPPKPELPKNNSSKVHSSGSFDRATKSHKSSASRSMAQNDGNVDIGSVKASRSFHSAAAMSNKSSKLKYSRSSSTDSKQSRSSEQGTRYGVVPPKPETSRVREGLETIIPTNSFNEPGFEKQDGFECIYNVEEENADFGDIRQVQSEIIPHRYKHVNELQSLRRVTTAKPRLSSNLQVQEYCTDENTASVDRAASGLLAKGPKEIRDDISALSALSPKNPNVRLSGQRKVHVLDTLSGGVFCCNADVSNAVISP
jgi:hypothetical protein